MPSVLPEEMARLVEEQVRSILDQRRGQPFTMEHSDTLETLSSQVGSMLQDRSMGRILNGPLWLSGTSVVNGTITATKLEVTELSAVSASAVSFNVTGNITAAASFPAVAARIVVNSSGLYGYQSDGVTTTFKLNVDGSGEIGSGSNKITWTNTGAIGIPAAVITSLTIANISGGIFGGTYTTSAGTARISISPTGIDASNSAGSTTFAIDATTGAMVILGSFTVMSAASGTRVVLSSAGGLEGYNGTTRTFFINAATGAGILGVTGGAGSNSIEWDQTGVRIGGVALSGGKITASGITVTNLAAINADLGTVTAGSITASLITAGTFINGGTGTIALGAADMTIASTGKLKFGASSADYLSNDLLHFEVAAGAAAKIEFKSGSIANYSYITSYAATNDTGIQINALGTTNRKAYMTAIGTNVDATTTVNLTTQSTASLLSQVVVSADGGFTFASLATSRMIYNGSWSFTLDDAAGAKSFAVSDSAGQVQFSIASNGAFVYPDADGTALGAYAGRMPWYVAGNLRYVPYYN